MALPKIEDARNLSDGDLEDEILSVKKKLFELRLLKATRRLEKMHEIKHTRHKLAQLLTVERERQLLVDQSTPSTTPTDSSPEEE